MALRWRMPVEDAKNVRTCYPSPHRPRTVETTEMRRARKPRYKHSPELSSISKTIQTPSPASSFSLPLPFSLLEPDSPSESSNPAALPLRPKALLVLAINGVPTNALALDVSPILNAPETSLEPFRHHPPWPPELDPEPGTGTIPADIVVDTPSEGILGSRRSCGPESKVTDESLGKGRSVRMAVRNLTQTTLDPVEGAVDLRRRRDVWRGRLKCALSRMESMEDKGEENATWVSWDGKSANSSNPCGAYNQQNARSMCGIKSQSHTRAERVLITF